MKDLVVVSDLHIGRGLNPETRRYFPLETFFFDADFRGFCQWLVARAQTRGRGFKLIINGDGFDFLRIHDALGPLSNEPTKRFSSELTPQSAARLVTEILAGHTDFVGGLADVVASGNELIILPGNHDLEVHWAQVQEAIVAAIRASLKAGASVVDAEGAAAVGVVDTIDDAVARVTFSPWFHYEPNRVWIEHGCQYDPENAFRFPLRGRLGDDPGFTPEGEVDLPLGNFFQRYLYNAFGSITFIVPTSRANGRYAKWLLINEPRLLLRVLTSHFPFALQVLRRVAGGSKERREAYRVAHAERLDELSKSSGLGETLLSIDKLKHTGADAALAVDSMVRGAAPLVAKGALSLLLFATAWITAGQAISAMELGFGAKSVLSLVLNIVVIAAAVGWAAHMVLRIPADLDPRPLKRAAEQIAVLAGVPLVLFGHTHEEVLFPLERRISKGKKAWYLNSGTWIAVFTHDVLLPRERVQFSFIDVVGDDATLMHWNPMRGAASPVILLDESGPSQPPTSTPSV
jgi:UDP-2,3-diacylglucosamine pyrophosphatase LpxH